MCSRAGLSRSSGAVATAHITTAREHASVTQTATMAIAPNPRDRFTNLSQSPPARSYTRDVQRTVFARAVLKRLLHVVMRRSVSITRAAWQLCRVVLDERKQLGGEALCGEYAE
jgi:hypothetical protein